MDYGYYIYGIFPLPGPQKLNLHDIIHLFQSTLNSLAIEVVENPPQLDTMIYNAAYLIPWEAEPQFGQLVEKLDRQFEQRLRIRYNNFTAPFNFARLRLLHSS